MGGTRILPHKNLRISIVTKSSIFLGEGFPNPDVREDPPTSTCYWTHDCMSVTNVPQVLAGTYVISMLSLQSKPHSLWLTSQASLSILDTHTHTHHNTTQDFIQDFRPGRGVQQQSVGLGAFLPHFFSLEIWPHY